MAVMVLLIVIVLLLLARRIVPKGAMTLVKLSLHLIYDVSSEYRGYTDGLL